MTTSAIAADKAALNDVQTSYASYASENPNCTPDCARILYGRIGAVDRALDHYLGDAVLQTTADMPGGYTYALIVFATPAECADATRDIRTRINVQVLDINGADIGEG